MYGQSYFTMPERVMSSPWPSTTTAFPCTHRISPIVERYHPDLVYFDWWVGQPDFRSHLERFATYYYNHSAAQQQPVALFYKLNDMADGSATLDLERGGLGDIRPQPWQTDTSLSDK